MGKSCFGEEMLIAFSIVCFIGWQCQMSLRSTLFKFVHVAYMFLPVSLHRWNCPKILFHQYVPKNWDVLLVVLAPKVRKQSVSNTRVDPGGKYGSTSCPKRVLS